MWLQPGGAGKGEMIAQMRFRRVGPILVNCATHGTLEDSVLDRWIEMLGQAGVTGQLSCALRTLQMTSPQRKRCANVAAKLGVRSAVVTDDRLGGGIVMAVGWLGADIRPFPWKQLEQAITFLGISVPGQREELLNVALELRRELES